MTREFDWLGARDPKPEGVGFYYLDHLTHNVYRGNMDTWFDFYANLFNFREIRFFDIEGKLTGLHLARADLALRQDPHPHQRDRRRQEPDRGIPQAVQGRGHPAHRGRQRATLRRHRRAGRQRRPFMPGPPEIYYEQSFERVPGHSEPIARMKRHGILIDGEGVVDGGETKILLQVFSKTVIGPIFFEFIQRKGDDGFGEGNFRALFESIEEDQIRRGVLKPQAAE